MTLLHKRQLILIERAKSIAEQKCRKIDTFSTQEYSSVADSNPIHFKFENLIFPMNDLSIEVDTPLLRENERNDALVYKERVQHQDHLSLEWKRREEPAPCKIVNLYEQIETGQNAEYFFFLYLQKEYGEAEVTPSRNWRSSNQLKIFPKYLHDIDDTVG